MEAGISESTPITYDIRYAVFYPLNSNAPEVRANASKSYREAVGS